MVQFASTTALDSVGPKERVGWLTAHAPECSDCRNAIFFKEMEGEIAKELGLFEEFRNGGDVTQHPKFQQIFGKFIATAVVQGKVNLAILAWMEEMVKRRGKPWPGRNQ
jgi:hypothetical protein